MIMAPGIVVLGTNGAEVTNNAAPSAAKGTDFGAVIIFCNASRRFSITNYYSNGF
jgi:hypothetical protein